MLVIANITTVFKIRLPILNLFSDRNRHFLPDHQLLTNKTEWSLVSIVKYKRHSSLMLLPSMRHSMAFGSAIFCVFCFFFLLLYLSAALTFRCTPLHLGTASEFTVISWDHSKQLKSITLFFLDKCQVKQRLQTSTCEKKEKERESKKDSHRPHDSYKGLHSQYKSTKREKKSSILLADVLYWITITAEIPFVRKIIFKESPHPHESIDMHYALLLTIGLRVLIVYWPVAILFVGQWLLANTL